MFDTRASFDAVLDCLCRVLACCCPVVAGARSVLTKAWRVIPRNLRILDEDGRLYSLTEIEEELAEDGADGV